MSTYLQMHQHAVSIKSLFIEYSECHHFNYDDEILQLFLDRKQGIH